MAAFYRVSFDTANNEDLRQSFALSDETGIPINLTGAQLNMGIDPIPALGPASGAATPALEASVGNGRIVLANPTAGQFAIAIPAAVMRTMSPGSYRHDLILTLASGEVHRVWAGSLTLQQGVAP
jgi:hypothetical protein